MEELEGASPRMCRSRCVLAAVVAGLALTLLPFRLALAGPVQTLAPVVDADGRLGQCDVLPGQVPGSTGLSWAQLAYNAGARVNRWEFRWDRIEPKRGIWSFGADDAAVASSRQAGLEVLGILIATPAWTVAPGQLRGNGVPGGLYLPYTDPHNLWATYVRNTVSHYRGQVQSWEVWNEPDLSYFWSGTPQEYFRLLKVAYLTVKETDPQATVLMAGMVVPDLSFVRQVLAAMTRDPRAASHHGFFDAVAWHAYGPADLVFTNIARYRAVLTRVGLPNEPLWVTEDGFPASNPNGEPRQAAYVLQTVAFALAAGADRVLVYRASDSTEPKTWGLVSSLGSPRMGYVAFQVAAEFFSHFQAVSYDPSSQLQRFAFYRPSDHVTLFWNRGVSDRLVTVSADGPTAQLVNWMGASTTLEAAHGQFQFTVPGAAYNAGVDPRGAVVGGPPVMLVQDDAPPSGLSQTLYVPAMQGTNRQIVLLNPGPDAATVELTAVTEPKKRIVLQLPSLSVQTVDLDLFAGPAYAGTYYLSSSSPVEVEGVADGLSVRASAPSATWYVPGSPGSLELGNPSARSVRVQITAFGQQGRLRARETLLLAPWREVTHSLPDVRGLFSLQIQAATPITLVSTPSGSLDAATQPSVSWYALRPGSSSLAMFDPDPHSAAQVDVQYVGTRAVRGEQLRLAPHHLFVASTHRAQVVSVSSSTPIAVAYHQRDPRAGAVTTRPQTEAAFAASGTARKLTVFNPGSEAAHLDLSVVGRAGSTESTTVLGPAGVSSFNLGPVTLDARGVLLKSDVPIVAGPSN